jgi:hypothetical protein
MYGKMHEDHMFEREPEDSTQSPAWRLTPRTRTLQKGWRNASRYLKEREKGIEGAKIVRANKMKGAMSALSGTDLPA